jgi:hypothetical protein
MTYKLYKAGWSVTEPNAAYYTDEQGRMISFLFDESNTDYQAYLKWVALGNTPQPADEVTK